MNARKVHAYRLVVDLTAEQQAPGHVPPALEEEQRDRGRWARDFEEQPFMWPRRRHYMSADAAARRAHKLASWGAVVRLERVELAEWEQVCEWQPCEPDDVGRTVELVPAAVTA